MINKAIGRVYRWLCEGSNPEFSVFCELMDLVHWTGAGAGSLPNSRAMPLVFMYGPDTVQGRMFDRIGPTEVRGGAVLSGFALSFDKPNLKDKREGLPNLQERSDAETFGVVFDVPAKLIDMLDGFFGGYEQRKLRPVLLEEETAVGATTWVARRTAESLLPSFAVKQATLEGMEENGAPEKFLQAMNSHDSLPNPIVELMVKFERGFEEEEARALMQAAGGQVRRRMRTDHEDEVMLLVKLSRERIEAIEADLAKHPKVTLVERNQGGFGIV